MPDILTIAGSALGFLPVALPAIRDAGASTRPCNEVDEAAEESGSSHERDGNVQSGLSAAHFVRLVAYRLVEIIARVQTGAFDLLHAGTMLAAVAKMSCFF